MMLTDMVPESADPDALYAAFTDWAADQGLSLYPHQDDALVELVSGANVILSTPTGSGKSLVATAAHFAALAAGCRSLAEARGYAVCTDTRVSLSGGATLPPLLRSAAPRSVLG